MEDEDKEGRDGFEHFLCERDYTIRNDGINECGLGRECAIEKKNECIVTR